MEIWEDLLTDFNENWESEEESKPQHFKVRSEEEPRPSKI